LGFTLAGSKRLQGMSSLATDLGLCGIFFFFFYIVIEVRQQAIITVNLLIVTVVHI